MPLLRGSSREVIQANIRKLVEEGYPVKQAVAISLKEARASRDRERKRRREEVRNRVRDRLDKK